MANVSLTSPSIGTVLAVVALILAIVFAAIGKLDIWIAALFVLTEIAILLP